MNEEGLNTLALQPGLENLGDKFRPLVAALGISTFLLLNADLRTGDFYDCPVRISDGDPLTVIYNGNGE